MDFYIPTSNKELSIRKLEEYAKYSDIINAGRRNPIWFQEEIFGIKSMDYQKWAMMESWTKRYILWLECRGAGKTTKLAVNSMTKMMLIPNYTLYVSANSAAQSVEMFLKLEDIALKKIPSFRSVTDIFAEEVARSPNSETGFLHNPAGHKATLYNNSGIITLSTNVDAIRGKRGAVLYDEASWQSSEQMAATEHFIDARADFKLGTGKLTYIEPEGFPLQLIYASSAGDVGTPFYDKYVLFSRKMFMGFDDYFVCDLNCDTVINYSTVDGEKIVSHLTQEAVDKSIEDDPDAADRELFNKFRKGGGANAIVKAETMLHNSTVRPPVLYNDTGTRKFILCYDPARNFDGSILSVWELIEDEKVGFRLEIANVISMVDKNTKAKTPLPMPSQLEIIRETMIAYNGEGAAEWENIELWIDAGAGGGGISAVADQLMADWTDAKGEKHRGVIDPDHKQYETARKAYPTAMPIVHLVDPQGHKKLMYDALEKMLKLNLMGFTLYDGKEYLMLDNGSSFDSYTLNSDEQLALAQIELLKNELLYMCRSETPSGALTYELVKEKRNKMHDDRAYTAAEAAWALSLKRRKRITTRPKEELTVSSAFKFKKPILTGKGDSWWRK